MFFGPRTSVVGHPRTTRESEPIPLAAGYEIRGVRIASFSQTDTDSWWMLGEGGGERGTIDVYQSIQSSMIQAPVRDRASKRGKIRYFHANEL